MPSSGLITAFSTESIKSKIKSLFDVTNVFGQQGGNHAVNNFSLASRKLLGLFNTNNPCDSACSNKYVNSIFTGGSFRINNTSKSTSGCSVIFVPSKKWVGSS